jgi:hypothetical protein
VLDRPRHHHYVFAHRELPSAAFRFGTDLVTAAREGRLALATVWDQVGATVPPDDRLPSAGLSVAYHALARHEVALVTLPAPDAPTEAHFVAIATEPVRLFTLEDAYSPMDGSRYTVLGEWTENGSHVNHGPGPSPRPDLFLAAVEERLDALPR